MNKTNLSILISIIPLACMALFGFLLRFPSYGEIGYRSSYFIIDQVRMLLAGGLVGAFAFGIAGWVISKDEPKTAAWKFSKALQIIDFVMTASVPIIFFIVLAGAAHAKY